MNGIVIVIDSGAAAVMVEHYARFSEARRVTDAETGWES